MPHQEQPSPTPDYQVALHPWPILGGSVSVPVGTYLSRRDWTYNGFPLPDALPVNLMALTKDAYEELHRYHEYHRVQTPPGFNRFKDPKAL